MVFIVSDTYMCPESHVKCKDHFCIQKDLVCNFHKDCSDGSDEVGCSYRECWAGEFQCNNGECIPPGFVCDGFVDCLDSSDEIYCLKGCKFSLYEFELNKFCVRNLR